MEKEKEGERECEILTDTTMGDTPPWEQIEQKAKHVGERPRV